jgi:hypothetical protein
MQEMPSNLELHDATNTIREVIFAFKTLSTTLSPSLGKIQRRKLNREGQYHIQP